jgi:hypothetical protein
MRNGTEVVGAPQTHRLGLPRYARALDSGGLPVMIALAAAAGQIVALTLYLPTILRDITRNSDWVAAMVIGERLAAARGWTYVATGVYGFYSTIWFEQATQRLPFHQVIWLAAPAAASVGGIALLVAAAARAAGAWAAALTLAMTLAASPITLAHLVVPANRQPTWFTMCLLGAFVILVAAAKKPTSGPVLVSAAVVGLVTGVNLASDPLMVALSGILPMLAAGIAAPFISGDRGRRGSALVTLALVLTLVTAAIATWAARKQSIQTTGLPGGPLAFATLPQVASNAALLFRGATDNLDANFFGKPVNTWSLLQGVSFVVGLVTIVALVARASRSIRSPLRPLGLIPIGLVFWATAVILVSTAFTLSRIPEEGSQQRYLVPFFFAVAAGFPLLVAAAGPRARVALSLVPIVFAVTAAHGLKQTASEHLLVAPYTNDLPALEEFLGSHGLFHGYGPYWDANALTWRSGMKVDMVAYDPCATSPGGSNSPTICFHLGMTAVTSRPGPTFVILDPTFWPQARLPVNQFGPPQDVYSVARFTVLTYDHDIGAQLTPPPGRSPFGGPSALR